MLDLYAGSGAFGLEALSRGASEAVFVENGMHGSSTAAPIARRVFDAYLLGKFDPPPGWKPPTPPAPPPAAGSAPATGSTPPAAGAAPGPTPTRTTPSPAPAVGATAPAAAAPTAPARPPRN